MQPRRVDDLSGDLAAEEVSFEEVLLTPTSSRDGFRRATGCALVRQQPLEDVDRGVERSANGTILRLAVPPTVLELFTQQARDDAVDILTKVDAEGDGPAV